MTIDELKKFKFAVITSNTISLFSIVDKINKESNKIIFTILKYPFDIDSLSEDKLQFCFTLDSFLTYLNNRLSDDFSVHLFADKDEATLFYELIK